MPPKRPAVPQASSSSASGAGSSQPRTKRRKSTGPLDGTALSGIKIYIVQAKLDAASIGMLFELAEAHGAAVCASVEESDVIVTDVRMRRRLERHVDWNLAHTKAVVTTQWLHDSVDRGKVLPCGDYAALRDLQVDTARNCPDCSCEGHQTDDDGSNPDPFVAPLPDNEKRSERSNHESGTAQDGNEEKSNCKKCGCSCGGVYKDSTRPAVVSPTSDPDTGGQNNALPTPPSSQAESPVLQPSDPSSSSPASSSSRPTPAHLLPPSPPLETRTDLLQYTDAYAVRRASPLVCANQALVAALEVVRRSRELEGEERSALSYARGIAVLKAFPRRITSTAQIHSLPFLGPKLSGMVQEFVDRGYIAESRYIAASPRFTTLALFASVYGIGPGTARMLWARELRTLDQLERYYDVDVDAVAAELGEREARVMTGAAADDADADASRIRKPSAGSGEELIKVALGFREDFSVKIPRDEVEEMAAVVRAEIDAVEPGCVCTIVGGYRRGKLDSNDVDIVFTHPDREKAEGLCKRVVKQLVEHGLITYVIHYSTARAHDALRTHHFDSLEKALSVFVLPPDSARAQAQVHTHGHRLRRRLDLIFARPEQYWCAVVGWSGSTMFQRDLRLWAKKEKGMKFDSSGMTRRRDSKLFHPKTEKEVFDILGLEWVDPTLRNADA